MQVAPGYCDLKDRLALFLDLFSHHSRDQVERDLPDRRDRRDRGDRGFLLTRHGPPRSLSRARCNNTASVRSTRQRPRSRNDSFREGERSGDP